MQQRRDVRDDTRVSLPPKHSNFLQSEKIGPHQSTEGSWGQAVASDGYGPSQGMNMMRSID
eukprot:2675933-Amphidinium_carterae.1